MKKIIKTILIVISLIAIWGIAGNLDQDEYIEVNSKPVSQNIYK